MYTFLYVSMAYSCLSLENLQQEVICDSYLQQYVDANREESVNLQGLRLANCRNQWRNVAELCKKLYKN